MMRMALLFCHLIVVTGDSVFDILQCCGGAGPARLGQARPVHRLYRLHLPSPPAHLANIGPTPSPARANCTLYIAGTQDEEKIQTRIVSPLTWTQHRGWRVEGGPW